MPAPRFLSPRYWIAGRALRLADDGMDPAAARHQAREEWETMPPHLRALYLAPTGARPAYQVVDDRTQEN